MSGVRCKKGCVFSSVVYGTFSATCTSTYKTYRLVDIFYKKYFKDVSREFDEFQVNTHLLQAALLVLVMYYDIWVSFFWEGFGRFYEI